ncbi:hypothetical protein HY620_00385 [Candidatus Uhrbacteria bacterium]|nr:hypothetical protein [Candidatus Uhrbacteria bacterium]
MIGIFLIALATFFEELSTSSAKESIARHIESISSRAFIIGISGFFFLVLSVVGGAEFRFTIASLPLVLVLVGCEIALTNITLRAILTADRSTFGFMRTLTIPFVLCIEIALGTTLTTLQILGIVALVFALLLVSSRDSFSHKGMALALLSAFGSSITISLYKYLITNYNSVAGQQIIASCMLLPYFYWHAVTRTGQHPFQLLRIRKVMGESLAHGVAGVLSSFAYAFAPASVIIAAKRSCAVFWSLVVGAVHFHERHIVEKAAMVGLAITGVVLLIR